MIERCNTFNNTYLQASLEKKKVRTTTLRSQA